MSVTSLLSAPSAGAVGARPKPARSFSARGAGVAPARPPAAAAPAPAVVRPLMPVAPAGPPVPGRSVRNRPCDGSSATARRPGAGSQLRLTRRGEWVLALVAALATTLLVLGTADGASSPPRPAASRSAAPVAVPGGSAAPAVREVVVEPGQTLWSLARALDPGADPRATVERIMAANRLSKARVQAGQRLVLPSDLGRTARHADDAS